MLKKLILENWKSFRYAELYFDPLTVLIGTNASGKSNVVEALEFLRRMATGETVDVALNGDRALPPIRGGSQGVVLKSEQNFTLKTLIQDKEQIDYMYCLRVGAILTAIPKNLSIRNENISWKSLDSESNNQVGLSHADSNLLINKSGLFVDYQIINRDDTIDNRKIIDLPLGSQQNALIIQQTRKKLLSLKSKIRQTIGEQLQTVLIVNPIPSQMRDFSRLSETFQHDGSNIAGVLAALPEDQKLEVETNLSHYLQHFPEGDIKKVWAEKIGRLGTDAMLYCQEEWQPGQIT